MTQLLRVQNFTVSRDGFGAGEGQSLERPFGHADPGELMAWALATAGFPNRSGPGGTRGLDDYFTRDFAHGIGAEIMGRNKFGPQRGPWTDHAWQGWWGDEPPFRTPVFVLTHHLRPSFSLGATTFHFVDGTPAEVLDQARSGRVNVSPAKAVEMAGQLFSRGQFGQAERVCRQMIQALPNNADAHNILGVTLNALNRQDEAIEELRQASRLAPHSSSIHANLGEVLRQAGRLEEARAALEGIDHELRELEQTRQHRDEQSVVQRDRIGQRRLDQQALAIRAGQLGGHASHGDALQPGDLHLRGLLLGLLLLSLLGLLRLRV